MPKGQLSTLTREFWMPFTFQAALLALQQPHKHPHSLQLAIYIQLAHHFIQYTLWAFLLLNHLWGKNHLSCSRFFNTILNTLLRLCQTVIGRWGSMSLVLQLWSWWLAFHSTKSSLCFFLQISLASCYPFLLASFPGLVSYHEGFVWTQMFGQRYVQLLAGCFMRPHGLSSFQANSAKCIHWWYTSTEHTCDHWWSSLTHIQIS